MARLFDFELSFLGRKHFAESIIDGVGVSSFRSIHSHRSMAMYLTGSFPNRLGNIFSQHPLPSKRSREVTKEQTAHLYHRNFTSAGYSASSVEKYHYPSDCHRRNRGNLLLIPGVLAVLQGRSQGVPDKVAKFIRNKVLVTCVFSFQSTSERFPILRFGINSFTCLKWESVFGGCFFKIS